MKGHQVSPAMRAVLGQCVYQHALALYWNNISTWFSKTASISRSGSGPTIWKVLSADAVCAAIGRMREKGCRITFHGPFWDLCSGSVDPGIRKVTVSRLGSLFDLVEKIRPEQVVCHTGFDPRHHRGHRREWIENSLSTWAPFVRRAEILEDAAGFGKCLGGRP